MKTTNIFLMTGIVMILLGMLHAPKGQAESEKLAVYTVNYPLQYFAERIGDDSVDVHFPKIEGDPAHWMPDAATLLEYQKADVILLNGAHYAQWIDKVALPKSKLVNTSQDFTDESIKMDNAVTHQHGPQGVHEHGDTAFTTWLDLTLAVKQAEAIKDAFVALLPGEAASLEENFKKLQKELLEIDARIVALISKSRQTPILFSHPVYQYFEKRYGLNAKSLHWEPDAMPAEAKWQELDALLATHQAKRMIWEAEPLKEITERLQALGIESAVFDPCANTPEKGDFMDVMKKNLKNLGAS